MEKKKLNLPFEKIYMIHCAEDKKRYDYCMRHFKELGIENNVNIWWTARRNYGEDIRKSFDGVVCPYYDSLFKANPYIYSGVLNVSLEHYTIIKMSYERGFNNVLILEDDVKFISDIDKLNEFMDNIPPDYDILKLFYIFGPSEEGYGDKYFTKKKVPNWGLICNSYALSRKGMEEMIRIYEEKIIPCDIVFEKIDEEKINAYVPVNILVEMPTYGSWTCN